MKIKFTINSKPATARDAVNALLHPDRLAEKMLQEKVGNLTCDEHPIQCRHLVIKVSGGKVKLENVCCDAFRGKVLQAFQSQSPAGAPPQS